MCIWRTILVFISVFNNISEEPIKVVVEHHQTCVGGIIIWLYNYPTLYVLLFLDIQYVFEFVYSTGSISVMSNYYNEQWMETILHQLVDGLSHYCKAHFLQCFIIPNTTGFPDFVHLQYSSTFHNVFQILSGFIIKMMIFFHQRLVSRPMFSDVGGSPAEARFF